MIVGNYYRDARASSASRHSSQWRSSCSPNTMQHLREGLPSRRQNSAVSGAPRARVLGLEITSRHGGSERPSTSTSRLVPTPKPSTALAPSRCWPGAAFAAPSSPPASSHPSHARLTLVAQPWSSPSSPRRRPGCRATVQPRRSMCSSHSHSPSRGRSRLVTRASQPTCEPHARTESRPPPRATPLSDARARHWSRMPRGMTCACGGRLGLTATQRQEAPRPVASTPG